MNAEAPGAKPSLSAIFRVFLVIGLTAFGGGATAHIHDAVVLRNRWLDERRMLEGMTITRIIPGANVSNLAAFVGSVLAGYRGAVVAMCGVVVPGVIAMLAVAVGYAALAEHSRHVQTCLHGLSAGAVGIMVSLVIDHSRPMLKSPAALFFGALAFLGVGLLQWNMLLVLVVLTPLASALVSAERKR